jgi:hypothetical protein
MEYEMESICQHAIWQLADLPPGQIALTTRWLYKTKLHADGSLATYKARLVVQGFRQRPGEDFDDMFTHVAKYNYLCILVALAAHQN